MPREIDSRIAWSASILVMPVNGSPRLFPCLEGWLDYYSVRETAPERTFDNCGPLDEMSHLASDPLRQSQDRKHQVVGGRVAAHPLARSKFFRGNRKLAVRPPPGRSPSSKHPP